MTPGGVVGEFFSDPRGALIERWNWKAAIFSATLRATLASSRVIARQPIFTGCPG
jgi:hypothetical protein